MIWHFSSVWGPFEAGPLGRRRSGWEDGGGIQKECSLSGQRFSPRNGTFVGLTPYVRQEGTHLGFVWVGGGGEGLNVGVAWVGRAVGTGGQDRAWAVIALVWFTLMPHN